MINIFIWNKYIIKCIYYKISSANQKNELFKHIWNIAEELRDKVDGWDFKWYVLGFLFYKYISENLCQYINKTEWESGNKNFDYASCSDDDINDEIKNQIIEEKGLFIYPSQLFSNLIKNASRNIEELNIIISNNFREIEASAIGTKSEDNVKGIFSIIKLDSNDLGNNVISRNKNLLNVINKINELDLGDFKNNYIDLIISLPSNLFYGTSIQTNIMVLSKSKQDKKIMFIDGFQKNIKQINQNILDDEPINLMVNTKEIVNFSKIVDINYNKLKENDFALNANNFIEDTSHVKEEKIDIIQLNKFISEIVKRNDELRKEIDLIIKEIGNEWAK